MWSGTLPYALYTNVLFGVEPLIRSVERLLFRLKIYIRVSAIWTENDPLHGEFV